MCSLQLVLGWRQLLEVEEGAGLVIEHLCQALDMKTHWNETRRTLYIESPAQGRHAALAAAPNLTGPDRIRAKRIIAEARDWLSGAGAAPSVKTPGSVTIHLALAHRTPPGISASFSWRGWSQNRKMAALIVEEVAAATGLPSLGVRVAPAKAPHVTLWVTPDAAQGNDDKDWCSAAGKAIYQGLARFWASPILDALQTKTRPDSLPVLHALLTSPEKLAAVGGNPYEAPASTPAETVMVLEPEILAVAEPEDLAVTEPKVPAVAEPEVLAVAEPEVLVVTEPEAPPVDQVLLIAAYHPDMEALDEPEEACVELIASADPIPEPLWAVLGKSVTLHAEPEASSQERVVVVEPDPVLILQPVPARSTAIRAEPATLPAKRVRARKVKSRAKVEVPTRAEETPAIPNPEPLVMPEPLLEPAPHFDPAPVAPTGPERPRISVFRWQSSDSIRATVTSSQTATRAKPRTSIAVFEQTHKPGNILSQIR